MTKLNQSELSTSNQKPSNVTSLIVEKLLPACLVVILVHSAFRSLFYYGIHADIMSNAELGRPFLALFLFFLLLAVPWVLQFFGLLRGLNNAVRVAVLALSVILALPAWVYVNFVVA